MKKILILAFLLFLTACGHKETKEEPYEKIYIEVDEDGNSHIHQYIINEYIDGEWKQRVGGTDLTPKEYAERLDEIFDNR